MTVGKDNKIYRKQRSVAKEDRDEKPDRETYCGLSYWDSKKSANDISHIARETKMNNRTIKKVRNEYEKYSTTQYTTKAIKYIRQHRRENPKKPMFMYLSYQAPHSPKSSPRKIVYKNKLRNTTKVLEKLLKPGYTLDESKYRKMTLSKKRIRHAKMVISLDLAIARIVNELKHRNMWDNTIFIFSSDNGGKTTGKSYGGASNGDLLGEKGMLFEGGIRAAAFIHSTRYFKDVQRSIQYNNLMHLIDWMPTMYHMGKCYPQLRHLQKKVLRVRHIDGVSQWNGMLLHARQNFYATRARYHPHRQNRVSRISVKNIRNNGRVRDELVHHFGASTLIGLRGRLQKRIHQSCPSLKRKYNLTKADASFRQNIFADSMVGRKLEKGTFMGSFKFIITDSHDLAKKDLEFQLKGAEARVTRRKTKRRKKSDSKKKGGSGLRKFSNIYFYNITADPFERRNLLDFRRQSKRRSAHLKIFCKMLNRFGEITKRIPSAKNDKSSIDMQFPDIILPRHNHQMWSPVYPRKQV